MPRKREYNFKKLLIEIPDGMHKWLKETGKVQHLSMARIITRLIGRCIIAEQNNEETR